VIETGRAKRDNGLDVRQRTEGCDGTGSSGAHSVGFTVVERFPSDQLQTAWRACHAESDFPTHYTAPEYFLEQFSQRERPFAVLALKEADVVGVITGVQAGDSVLCGLAPRPQICVRRTADRDVVEDALARGLLSFAGRRDLITVYTWTPSRALPNYRFRFCEEQGVVMLDLSRGSAALFKEFSSNRRVNINKAIKNGVEVFQAATADDIATYYEIYCTWCERKGVPAQSLGRLRSLLELKENRRLLLARHRGTIVAGIILRFVSGGLIEYAANASREDALSVRPNDLLHWRAIEWACSAGFTHYSLGGAHLFLRKFGGGTVPTFRYRLDQSYLRRYDLRDALMASGRTAFQHLPDAIKHYVRRLGRNTPD
jgi:GNAT acetyltransferase-like protein